MRRKSILPSWKGPFEDWSRKFVKKNFWRVEYTVLSEEDAVQECAMVFAKICYTYAHTIDNTAWLMAIYKTAVGNHFHTITRRQNHINWQTGVVGGHLQTISTEQPTTGDESGEIATIEGSASGDHALVDMWASASDELKQVLLALNEGTAEFCEWMMDAPAKDLSRHWRRLLNLPTKLPIARELQHLLGVAVDDNII